MPRYNHDSLRVVGISEMAVTTEPSDVLVTYSLGSCVGVTLYDPINQIGGMIHCLLPSSVRDRAKAKENPYMFVDTGVVQMIQSVLNRGAERKNLICKVAGAGTPLGDERRFAVGAKNYAVLRKVLDKNKIPIQGECIGGPEPKTLFLDCATGKTIIRVGEKKEEEL